jgi:hypothetical protein
MSKRRGGWLIIEADHAVDSTGAAAADFMKRH